MNYLHVKAYFTNVHLLVHSISVNGPLTHGRGTYTIISHNSSAWFSFNSINTLNHKATLQSHNWHVQFGALEEKNLNNNKNYNYYYKLKFGSSVHHHTIQINQPTRCNNFPSLLLDVYVQLNMFRASSRPSSGGQQLQ